MVKTIDIIKMYTDEAIGDLPVKWNVSHPPSKSSYGATESIWIEADEPPLNNMVRVTVEGNTIGIDVEVWDREFHPDYGGGSWVLVRRNLYKAFDMVNPEFISDYIPTLRRAIKMHIFGSLK